MLAVFLWLKGWETTSKGSNKMGNNFYKTGEFSLIRDSFQKIHKLLRQATSLSGV